MSTESLNDRSRASGEKGIEPSTIQGKINNLVTYVSGIAPGSIREVALDHVITQRLLLPRFYASDQVTPTGTKYTPGKPGHPYTQLLETIGERKKDEPPDYANTIQDVFTLARSVEEHMVKRPEPLAESDPYGNQFDTLPEVEPAEVTSLLIALRSTNRKKTNP